MSLKFSPDVLEKFDLKTIRNKEDLIALINNDIKHRIAKTPAEKLEVLDLRDKILKFIRHGSENESIIGSCMDMCQEKERYHRELINQYKSYETKKDEFTGASVLDHRLMIKEYSRSSAAQDLPLSNELRPSGALLRTIQYLLKEILSQVQFKSNEGFYIADWYDFIWNRTRSIRKDITQQRLNDQISVQIHEICARFHIYCSHRFSDQPPDVFNYKINNDNLKNCLQSLIEFYDDPLTVNNVNEAEFRSYIILSKLEDGNILSKTQRLKPNIRNSNEVNYAIKLFHAYSSKNYVKFFRLVSDRRFSYMAACLTHRYFAQMRIDALKAISVAYKQANERQFPLDKLIEILGFDNEDDACYFCEQLNIDIVGDQNEKFILFQSQFRNTNIDKAVTDRLRSRRSFRLVESKFNSEHQRICDIIYGGNLSRINLDLNLKQQSFDANGNYIGYDLLNDIEADNHRRDRSRTPPPQRLAAPQEPTILSQPATATSTAFSQLGSQRPNMFSNLQPAPRPNLFTTIASDKPPSSRNLFGDLLVNQQPRQQQQQEQIPQASTLFTSYKRPIESISLLQTIQQQPPAQPIPTIQPSIKFNFIEDIYKDLISDFTKSYLTGYLEQEFKESYISNFVLEETIKQMIDQTIKTEFIKDSYMKQLTDEIINETIRQMLYYLLKEEAKIVKTSQNQVDYYSNKLYDDLYIDLFSTELNMILAELKYEYLESLYINVYFNDIFPQHITEILQECVYEDTQFNLNVNLDLTNDIKLSIDYALVKFVYSKWYLKLKKKIQQKQLQLSPQQQQQQQEPLLNRIELTKQYLFKFIRCENYLLHLCWLPVNYQYFINSLSYLHRNSLLFYKIMFIIPKLNNTELNESESIKRWLLSKFFQFDRNTYTYNTQYSYHFLNSFLQQFGIKFLIKAYFMNNANKLENEKARRIYYGSTGVIFILMPFLGNDAQQFQAYLNENRTQLREIIKLVNENLDEDEIIANLNFFVISYLNDEKQTEYAIDFILKSNNSKKQSYSANRVTYCLLDGKVVRDNLKIEENFSNYLTSSYIQTPNECLSLNVLSFIDIFNLTILKFFDYLIKKNLNIPFDVIIEEYNSRLDLLIRFLAKDKYKKLTWPIPEHTDFTNAWLAKYWNTHEVIDDKLYEIKNLLTLNLSRINFNEYDYKKTKNNILNYLHRIKKDKSMNLDEFESIYQAESKISDILKELEANKKEIKWQKLILIVIEFILSNGFVNFRSKKIRFDQFTIYCDTNELKSFDWINCGENRIQEFETSEINATINNNKENIDYDTSFNKTNKQELSEYKLNRTYFNFATNKKLNQEFDQKIKNFMNLVNEEKAHVSTLDTRLSVNNTTSEKQLITNQNEQISEQNKLTNVNRLDKLLKSLNEETNYNDKLNEKFRKRLKE